MKIGVTATIAYLIFIFQGLTAPLGNVMIIEIARKYGVDTSVIGYVFAMGIIGGGIAALASGYLIKRFGKRIVVFAGIIIALLAGIAITTSNYLLIFAVGMILSSVSNWFLVAVANFIIVQTYQGEKRSSRLNLLNFFYSIGALITPTLAGVMLEEGISWEFVFITPFFVLGILAVMAYSPAFGEVEKVIAVDGESSQPVQAEKWTMNIYLTGAALGCYCVAEVGYTSWIVVHLRENLTVDIVAASLVLTAFYICQAGGRFVSGFIVKYMALNRFIIICSSLGFIGTFFILVSKSYTAVFLLTIVMALGIASLYPSILSYGTLQVKLASPRIMTFFLTSGIIGSVGGLLITSFLKQYFGVLACIATAAVTLVLVIVCIGATMLKKPQGDMESSFLKSN